MGRDSVAGIVIRYGRSGAGIEALHGRDFSHTSRPSLGLTQASVLRVRDLFPGVRRLGRGVNLPLPYSDEVKERVELYLYSPSVPSWQATGWSLPFREDSKTNYEHYATPLVLTILATVACICVCVCIYVYIYLSLEWVAEFTSKLSRKAQSRAMPCSENYSSISSAVIFLRISQ